MAHSRVYQFLVRSLYQARRLNLHQSGRPLPVAKSQGRRQFIKSAVAGISTFATLGQIPLTVAEANKKIVVVGAGLAGLNAAYQLKKAGFTAEVYEASNRVGGRIRTVTGIVGPNIESDLGGELVNTNHADLLGLADEFGIGVTPRKEPNEALEKIGFYFGGRRCTEMEMVTALQPLAEQMMMDAELLDADWDTHAPQFDKLSVSDYLQKHRQLIPRDPDIRQLIESIVRVEYGVEAKYSTALQLLFALPAIDGEHIELISESDEAYVLNSGSESVIHALAEILKPQIQLNRGLTKLEQTERSYRLTFNGEYVVEADYVVLALPLPALRKVAMKVQLPKTLSQFIKNVDLGRNEKIVAGMNQRVWRNKLGFEIEAWNDQSVALLWDSSLRQLKQTQGALTFFLSADDVKHYAKGRAEDHGKQLLQEYDSLIANLVAESSGKFLRSAWHQTPGINGSYTNFKPGQYTGLASDWLYVESEDPEEVVNFHVEKLVFAGEHTSDEFYGFMNGAAQSGRLAAQWILTDIKNS